MSERAPMVDEGTMKFGLLMESAQAHQKLAETHLEQLRAHTRDLDGVVRDEIRRTMIEELQMLTAETRQAADALRRMRRGISVRAAVWGLFAVMLCAAVPVAIVQWVLPSERDIATLRARRDAMAASVSTLERQGGRIDWRRCGDAGRLCVRVEHKAPGYGDKGDYYIVAGY